MFVFHRKLYRQKPKQWGPFSAVQSALFHNAERMGIDPSSIWRAYPHWENAGNIIHDYANSDNAVSSLNTWSDNNLVYSNQDGQGYRTNEEFSVPANSDFSVILDNIRVGYTGGATQTWFIRNYETGYGFSIRIPDWSSTVSLNISSNYTTGGFSDTPGIGYHNYAITRVGGENTALYRDGKKISTNTLSGSLTPPGNIKVQVAQNGSYGDYSGQIGGILMLKSGLFDELGGLLTDNFWRLWQPRTPTYFSLPDTGTPPSTLLPTNLNIASSVGTVLLSRIRALTPSDISIASDVSNTAIAGIVNILTGQNISSDSLITQASVQAIRKLMNVEISSISQVTNTALTVARKVGLTDIASQTEVTSVVFSVVRRLAGNNISISSEIMDAAIKVVHHVGINNLSTASEITDAAILITGAIAGIDVQSQADVIDIAISVIRAIKNNDISSGSAIESATLQAIRQLSFIDISSTTAIENVVITSGQAFSITDITSLSSITNAVMTVVRAMAPININIQSEVSSPLVSVLRQIFVNVVESETTITGAGLSIVGISIVGKVTVTFSMATPGVDFSIATPGVEFEVK